MLKTIISETPVETPPNKTTVLYLPFLRLPKDPEEMIERLTTASGIHQSDLRYKMVGRGVNRLTPSLSLKKQEDLVAEMTSMGIPSVIVDEQSIKRSMKFPAAQRVEITDADMCFFDRDGNPILRIDKNMDLLIIAADLTGKRPKKIMITPDLDQQVSGPSFEESLKKTSLGIPAAVFCRVGGENVEGVMLHPSAFHYNSMDEYMQVSAAANFRELILHAVKRSKTCITDNGFSTTTLARISYDENSSSREILGNLARYTAYMLTAAESGLILPGAKMAADFSFKQPYLEDANQEKDANQETDPQKENDRPQPPPPVRHSGIIARLFATPWEIVPVFLILLGPAFSVFLQSWHLNNPAFWKTSAGLTFLGAGIVLFPYGLLLLTYKRMVENTPTSKVRSMAMGIAEISGQARQYYDLKTSHSGTRCVYFRCRYFRRKGARFTGRAAFLRHMARNSETWVLEREVSSGRLPFYIEDETGRVLVKPEGALFHITKHTQQFSGTFGMWMSEAKRSDSKVHEDLIAEGARIYVLGKARPEKIGDSVSEKISKHLQALKKDEKRLMEYDTNNNGRLDPEEWDIARKDAENIVYAEMLASGGQKEQIVIGRPDYGFLPFIIADSEEEILRRLGFRVWIFLAGGMLLIITGVQMLRQL